MEPNAENTTIVSLGTTLPEVLFSTMASVRHLPEMAIGNALGSILCNTGFIAGMMLVLRPIYLSGKAVANVVSGTVFLGLSFAVYVAGGVMGQGLSRTTGGMLLVICILFLAYNVRNAYSQQQEEKEMHAQEQAFGISDIIRLVLEAVVIYIGASMLVEVGPKLARAFGVPEMIISLTFVALGTSLPELVTSLMALRKKHASLSMGNIIGADILNFVMVGGLSAVICPIPFQESILKLELPVIFFMLFILCVPSISRKKAGRLQGLLLLGSYILYLTVLAA